ncbi:MAG TPA: hypothetical protein PLJ93_02805 [Candidatus Mcinerneyibacteriales bacterium]|nr:hypothetical protein [Candidatus Mcinerneyibacteriales bacterium]
MRSVSKVLLGIILLAGVLNASALELKTADPGPRASVIYEIPRLAEGERPGAYPAAYLGYERQMISGILRGRGDFNGTLNFGYTPRELVILLRIHDNEIVDDSLRENDSFTLVLSLDGYPERKIHWDSSGMTETVPSGAGHVRVERAAQQDRVYLISFPWGSWPLLQHRPYRLQLWAYDNDDWGQKIMRLQEQPLELVLSPPLPGEETALAAGRFYLRSEDSLTLFGEFYSPKRETRPITFRINGREISRSFLLEEGRTPFELVLAPGEWKEKTLVEWDSPEGSRSLLFDVVIVNDNRLPVRSDQDIADNAFLQSHAVTRYGLLFKTPYEIFTMPGRDGTCRWVITGSYEKACRLLRAAQEGYRGGLSVYVYPQGSPAPLAPDFASLWEESGAESLFLEGEAGRVFLDMIKNGPASTRPSLHLIHIQDPGSFLYDPQVDSLRSYQVTLWEGQPMQGIAYPDFFRIRALPDNNDLRAFLSETEGLPGEEKPFFLRSTSLTHNRMGHMEIYELLHYEIPFFSASLDPGHNPQEIFTENIRYFTYPVGEGQEALLLNGKSYPVFPGHLNRFSLDEKNNVWNIFVSESIVLPAVKDFFSGPVSSFDKETARKMKEMTGYEPPVAQGPRLLYWGKTLPGELKSSFQITIDDDDVTTMNGNRIRLDELFLIVFEEEGRLLLWMTADPSGLFSAPSNYIVFDDDGQITRLGGVMPR